MILGDDRLARFRLQSVQLEVSNHEECIIQAAALEAVRLTLGGSQNPEKQKQGNL